MSFDSQYTKNINKEMAGRSNAKDHIITEYEYMNFAYSEILKNIHCPNCDAQQSLYFTPVSITCRACCSFFDKLFFSHSDYIDADNREQYVKEYMNG